MTEICLSLLNISTFLCITLSLSPSPLSLCLSLIPFLFSFLYSSSYTPLFNPSLPLSLSPPPLLPFTLPLTLSYFQPSLSLSLLSLLPYTYFYTLLPIPHLLSIRSFPPCLSFLTSSSHSFYLFFLAIPSSTLLIPLFLSTSSLSRPSL